MKGISFLTALVLSPLALAASLAAAAPSADQALKILQEGNARFAAGNLQHPNQSSVRRTEVLAGQTPFVTVLTCSDSRVPVETLFDQGVGDVFVVRVAGNVAKTDEIGSIEYGAGHLGTPLLLVLGHTKCGAVKAVAEGAEVGGSIPELVAPIAPVVERVRAENPNLASDALIAKAVTANVWNSIENIFQTSSEIRELVKEGKLTVVGGVYDLATGAVEVLGSHPQQARLLAAGEESGTQEHAAVSTTPEPSAATAATAPAGAAPELSTSVGIGGLAVGGAVLALVLWGAWSFSRTGMKNWTVGRRIGVGFATVLLVLSGLAAVSYVNFHTSFDSFTEYRAIARHSNLAGRIQANFLKMRIVVKDFQVTRNRSEIQTFDQRKVMVFKFVEEGKAALADSSERLKFITEVESELTKYVAGFAEMSKSGTSTTRINQLAKGMAANGETIDRQIENLKLSLISEQDHIAPSLQAQMQYIQSLMLWIGLAAIVLGAVFAFIIDRSIVLPLRALSNSIRDCADQTSSAAGQVSSSSQTLAEGASEQAASIEETSASIEEISSMTKHNAESATQAKDLSNQTRAAADTGASDMEQMKSAMDAIKASSGEIAKIVKTIDEIAFQTNILALNAAVEAARAGEAGAGFAVVAEEVRNLAQRSAQSAKETASKIEESISRSEHGVNISAKVADSLQLIVERARSMDNLVAEIAKASTEQSQGLGQVNTAISQIDKVTQSNAGNAEETASAAEELSSQAVSMHEMTEELLRLVGTSQGHTTARMPAAAMAVTKTEPKQTAAKQARVSRRQQKQSVATQANGKGDHDDFFADA